LLVELLGSATRRAGWPQEEIVAFDAVYEVIGRIGALDRVGGSAPTPLDFRTALGAELDAPAPSTARFGHGLLVGDVQEAIGLDLDVVYVVGMVDGAFPVPRAEDVLLPNRERARAAGEVPLRERDAAESRRDVLAALRSAREGVLSYARYDQRHGRELRPARVLVELLEALAGDGRRFSRRELVAGPLPSLADGKFQFVASFADAVRDVEGCDDAVSEADWCLRSLTRWVATGGSVLDHFLAKHDAVLAAALSVRRARRSERFTRFDGLVEHVEIPSPLTGVVQSATGLESFARCPRRYYFSHLLGVAARQAPEAALQLSPGDRGVLIHRVLERLVGDEIDRHPGSEPDTGDAPGADDLAAREARMLAYAEEELVDAQRRGVTGHPALWALERSRMLSDLREHLRVEAEHRAVTGAHPIAVELQFGSTSGADLVVETPNGPVRFRGRLDRVDELEDGSLAVVDYKSGRRYPLEREGDQLAGGTRLQLPVYALAAKAAYGAERNVRAAYMFVGAPTAPEWTFLDDSLEQQLAQVVGTLSEVIGAGRFPARPGPSDGRGGPGANCVYCPYDAMCPPDRAPAWHRKKRDPALGAYVALVGET
jgi:ATP-dependent helicase/nuclease subunit B